MFTKLNSIILFALVAFWLGRLLYPLYIKFLKKIHAGKTIREEAVPEPGNEQEETAADTIVVNARAEIGPKELQDLTLAALDAAFSDYIFTGTNICTLIPGRPNPTYHYDHVVWYWY